MTAFIKKGKEGKQAMELDLGQIRRHMDAYAQAHLDRDGRYGSYRKLPRERCDLYASTDMAIARTIMGEDLRALPQEQRAEWIARTSIERTGAIPIRSGTPPCTPTAWSSARWAHWAAGKSIPAGSTTISAGPNRSPRGWSASIGCANGPPPTGSGGMLCYSFSKSCTQEWKDAVRQWLLDNSDEATGYWRKGVVPGDRHQALGGFVHIVPIFEHQGWAHPYLERAVDSVLALQLPDGPWFSGKAVFCATYLDLDALYVLAYAQRTMPDYRGTDIRLACRRYLSAILRDYASHGDALYGQHPHHILAAVGVFGLLQQLLPDMVRDDRAWTDIFSDRRFYQTEAVECEASL